MNEEKSTKKMMESIDDLVTVVTLNRNFSVHEEKEGYVLVPPAAGTMIKVPKLEPSLCAGKYLNNSTIDFLMELGIEVQKTSLLKNGAKRSYVIRGHDVDGMEITVQVFLAKDWNNPYPNPLSPKKMWFVSKNREDAIPKYRILKEFLISQNFKILGHDCMPRNIKMEKDCLGPNNGENGDNGNNEGNGKGITLLSEEVETEEEET